MSKFARFMSAFILCAIFCFSPMNASYSKTSLEDTLKRISGILGIPTSLGRGSTKYAAGLSPKDIKILTPGYNDVILEQRPQIIWFNPDKTTPNNYKILISKENAESVKMSVAVINQPESNKIINYPANQPSLSLGEHYKICILKEDKILSCNPFAIATINQIKNVNEVFSKIDASKYNSSDKALLKYGFLTSNSNAEENFFRHDARLILLNEFFKKPGRDYEELIVEKLKSLNINVNDLL